MRFLMTRHKLTDICPEMIVRSGKPDGEEFSPSAVPLVSSPHVANLKRIICNVYEPVLLRVLVCKDENIAGGADTCLYPDHKNDEAIKLACNDCDNLLAQVYIRLDRPNGNRTLRSCVIAFVEGKYLSRTDDLLNRLHYSIAWLDIERERPHFYIFYYGQPMFQLNANNSRQLINNRIKEMFHIYSQEEDVCIVAPVGRYAESLIISHRNIFSCKAS
jgi:hypothetical protein